MGFWVRNQQQSNSKTQAFADLRVPAARERLRECRFRVSGGRERLRGCRFRWPGDQGEAE